MRGRKARAASLLLAAALGASLLTVPASAAAEGVVVYSDTIGGRTAQIVGVEMIPGRTGKIGLANNSVVESAGVQSIIDGVNAQPDTQVVAAINGGFFNSYTKGDWSFPGNCPTILNAVVTDGELIHTGNTTALGFTADGTPMIDWVVLRAQVDLGMSSGFQPGCWSVNTYENDPSAIMLFDEHLTLPVAIPSSATMFFIENGRITRVEPGSTLNGIPAGIKVLVYGSEVYNLEKGYNRLPEVGMPAKVVIKASGTGRDAAWENVREALVGCRILVKDGANVAADSRNSYFDGDSKQRADAVLARSFVGVTNNGGMVMGTVTASFTQIGDWMVANGIREGVAMDGGASCMLYAGGTYVTRAGRNLASVLAIVDKGSSGGQTPGTPAEPAAPGASGQPSGWAVAEIQSAIDAGLVPQDIQSDYQGRITRQDFCRLIWELLKTQPGMDQKLQGSARVEFSDTSNASVMNCARLGIISGVGGGLFEPNRELKRSEAAKILALTTQLLGVADTGAKYTAFTDRDRFDWAESFIDFCGVNGIMNGEDGAFNPNGTFSREQAVATILRISQRYGK